jgi:hypothetical protein
MRWIIHVIATFSVFAVSAWAAEPAAGLQIDKAKKTVTIPCIVAPRKLPHLQEIYPIEVIACHPHPKGKKAHETVVIFDGVKPSEVHKALEQLGLKPGKPAKGEGAKAEGPEVAVALEVTGPDGPKETPIEKFLVDRKTGKPMPALKWHFTGSAMSQPDPEKPDKAYGADLSGTLIAIFPVTDETVLQTNLTMKDETLIKLETNKSSLPKEGEKVRLIIRVK